MLYFCKDRPAICRIMGSQIVGRPQKQLHTRVWVENLSCFWDLFHSLFSQDYWLAKVQCPCRKEKLLSSDMSQEAPNMLRADNILKTNYSVSIWWLGGSLPKLLDRSDWTEELDFKTIQVRFYTHLKKIPSSYRWVYLSNLLHIQGL